MDAADQHGFEQVVAAKASLQGRLQGRPSPHIGIVLGSGLSPLSEKLTDTLAIPYSDIPSMPSPRVIGHDGRLVLGQLGGKPVACLSGRSHLYEGHSPSAAVFGVRLLAALGVSRVILTNAAGGIADACTPGALMLISDHLNLTGKTPLLGPNEDRWGPRFVDMSEAYSLTLRGLARSSASALGLSIQEGVYAGLLGPTYETPAEIHMLETMGASAVGMSTVLETIALRHQGVEVLGISCITNKAAGKSAAHLSHEEVAEVAGRASDNFVALVSKIVSSL